MTKADIEFVEGLASADMPRGDIQACVEAYAMTHGLDDDELFRMIDERMK